MRFMLPAGQFSAVAYLRKLREACLYGGTGAGAEVEGMETARFLDRVGDLPVFQEGADKLGVFLRQEVESSWDGSVLNLRFFSTAPDAMFTFGRAHIAGSQSTVIADAVQGWETACEVCFDQAFHGCLEPIVNCLKTELTGKLRDRDGLFLMTRLHCLMVDIGRALCDPEEHQHLPGVTLRNPGECAAYMSLKARIWVAGAMGEEVGRSDLVLAGLVREEDPDFVCALASDRLNAAWSRTPHNRFYQDLGVE